MPGTAMRALVADLKARISEGGLREAALRALLYVGSARGMVDERSIEALRQIRREHGGEPLMSGDFLSQVIRSYGAGVRTAMGSYLEQSLKLFANAQRDARASLKGMRDPDSAEAVNHLAQRNYLRWRSVQDEIYRTLMNAGRVRPELEEKNGVSAHD